MRAGRLYDLQARSAYQPVIHHQGDRWIAYVGHHGGTGELEAADRHERENNGTSIVDVTDPKQAQVSRRISRARTGQGEQGGAQMVRVCNGNDLPNGDQAKFYLLRTAATRRTKSGTSPIPRRPTLLTTVVSGLAHA